MGMAIVKYVMANNKLGTDASKVSKQINLALKKAVADGALKPAAVAGRKGAGSYRLGEKPKVVKKKPAAKKATPKKKPAVKKATKATPKKKPAAKKATKATPKKKPAAKKATPKKAAPKKKPAATKASPKKSAKKAAKK